MRRFHRTIIRTAIAAAVAIAAGGAHATIIDVTISNVAPREITGLYAAATAQSKWGSDQLNGVPLVQGDSFTLHVSCEQSFVLVAEDVSGCFAYQSFACASGGSWSLTSSTTRDCGR